MSRLISSNDILFARRAIAPGSAVPSPVTFGEPILDGRLGGGLAQRALHEFYAVSSEDAPAAAGFATMVAMRGCAPGRPVVWIREDAGVRRSGGLYAAGLAELGFDPGNLVLVQTSDMRALLRAAADTVKCGQVGAVVVEPWGKAPLLDLTASRRLSMAAAASGVFTLMLRVDALPVPSAAHTRWQVAAAPSTALAASAPGHPAFDIMLLRHRGGVAGFESRLEWNRDRASFAPLSGGVPAASAVGADWQRQAA